MLEIAIALPFVNAYMNRNPRGLYGWGPFATGAALALIIFLATLNVYAAGAFYAAYLAGESFGWGKWLGTIPWWNDKAIGQGYYMQSPFPARKDGKNNGVHALANKVAPENEDFRKYAYYALVFRGGLWCALIFIALTATGVVNIAAAALAVVAGAFAFPHAYMLGYKLNKEKYWTYGEHIYGGVMGALIAASLMI